MKDELDALDSDDATGDDPQKEQEEYELWKIRELKRIRRDREAREEIEREKAEVSAVALIHPRKKSSLLFFIRRNRLHRLSMHCVLCMVHFLGSQHAQYKCPRIELGSP